MPRKEKSSSSSNSDRVKTLIRHIRNQHLYYSVSSCVFHLNKPCLTLFNNHNHERFHCLYANQAIQWCSYSITKSCDIPESFHDMILLNKILGNKYVLPFAGSFRESSGYTIGMFRQDVELYSPQIINRTNFAETFFTLIVIYAAVCHRLGGNSPNVNYFSFLYTVNHPVLCDIGSFNVENRERIDHRKEHFNKKKWKKFLNQKTSTKIVKYMKSRFPNFFQNKKKNKICILNEEEEGFSDETHKLVCQSEKKCMLDIIKEFKYLIGDKRLNFGLLTDWIQSASEDDCFIDNC